MNHGKIDKEKAQTTLDKWNNAIARILGKRDKKRIDYKKPTSDGKFGLIVIGMVIFLWLLTGIYYIPQNMSGIIMHNGIVTNVKSGIAIGIDYPYPLSDLAVIDTASDSFSIGKTENDKFVVISKDNKSLQMIVELAYRISDPARYFVSHYQENADLKQAIKGQVQSSIQAYTVNINSNELLSASSIVTANDIRKNSESDLSNFGITIEKLAIIKLSNLDKLEQKNTTTNLNATNSINIIIKQALQYKSYIESDVKLEVEEFNALLPQYKSNPNTIAQLMYYKMLSSVPQAESATPDFSLLQGSLSEFKQKIDMGVFDKNQSSTQDSDVRRLDRSVDRQREFKGR
jgi:regulator of protease activity HflC (stomatin/prohibitin superfamily)